MEIGMMSREQLANALGISYSTLQGWEKDGCPVHRHNGIIRYDLQEVKAWMKKPAVASGEQS